MKKILLTGASGYVGRAIVSYLSNTELFSIDRSSDKNVAIKSNKFIHKDLNNLSSEDRDDLNSFSGTIIHSAAARSDDSLKQIYLDDNIAATKVFIDALDPKKIKKFIHIGSVAAIDGEYLNREGVSPISSDDIYRITKFQQQEIIESWAMKNNIHLIILAPSAIYDAESSSNSTNIGRLEKAIGIFKFAPEINVYKSLTSMNSLVKAIEYFLNREIENINQINNHLIERYIIIDRPIQTVTEICKKKFKAKCIIKIPGLKKILLLIAFLINLMKLKKIIPLTKDRIEKLYKSTEYINVRGYQDWINEEN